MESTPTNCNEANQVNVESTTQKTTVLHWKAGIDRHLSCMESLSFAVNHWKKSLNNDTARLEEMKTKAPKYLEAYQRLENQHQQKVKKLKKQIRLKEKEIKYLKDQVKVKNGLLKSKKE
jgi:predicted RNase H-like nuclease (RuvC/YqgF family)